MPYQCTTDTLQNISQGCVCLFVDSKQQPSPQAEQLSAEAQADITHAIEACSFSGKNAETLFLPSHRSRPFHLLLIGTGESEKLDANTVGKFLKATASALKANKQSKAHLAIGTIDQISSAQQASQLIEAIQDIKYAFTTYKSEASEDNWLEDFVFHCPENDLADVQSIIDYQIAVSAGKALTRDLGNEPGNVCTPEYLAEQAIALGQEFDTITTHVLVESELEEMGMGAFVSVAKGSNQEGALITMEYKGAGEDEAPYVLVGKGITFDTGGISLKPGAQMDEMKFDMCGAASVFGVMKAIALSKPKQNVVGVVAAAENMPAGHASKPGDIVKTLSGQTVEILNTDAEGRLVLCDTLTYVERFKPAAVVDIATLTGACIIALGHATSAVMGNNQELVDALLEAGQEAQDKAWQLPIWDEYQTQLDSPFADMQNIGGKGAGSITAACFLSRFAKSFPWAHLDIAGTAWVSGGKDKGATGRPVPLLMKYLSNQREA